MNKQEKHPPETASEKIYEGLEIGAVSVKWVRRTVEGDTIAEIMQHGGNPRDKILNVANHHKGIENGRIVTTGHAAQILLDLPYRSESECMEKALAYHAIKPDLLLSLGGETFSVYPMKDGMIRDIVSTSKCAAGTGEFIVQQFQRMGLSLETGLKASLNGQIVKMATRCSVHCKSDATHKLNKGECLPGDIAKSLIFDLSKKVSEMVDLLQWPTSVIVVAGGVALNDVFIEHFREHFQDSEIKVLAESPYLEAFGASLYAAELSDDVFISSSDNWMKSEKIEFMHLEPLQAAQESLEYKVQKDTELEVIEDASYILGVDAGSTTTKAILFNVSYGSLAASTYLRTLGNPVLATKNCLNELIRQVGGKPIRVVQIGATGSGREMVSVYLDNCQSYNEILAHARAAAEELPDVDTVFEIGGQDSKFISFLQGVPIDYAMNEGCSAGTGSFLEESASVDMGVTVEDISQLAENSENPIAFGERCAAFINTDLRNALQQGAGQEDVIAGLVYSIADNYISRIVGPRHVGRNLLFLGGVALNKSVGLALAARAKRKIVVPAHPELMGCVGTALMTKDRLRSGDLTKGDHSLDLLARGDMETKETFRCKACENNCEIQRIAIRDRIYPFGGLCSKYDIERHKGKGVDEGRDLIAIRNQMMFEQFGPRQLDRPRGRIGLPMALTAFDLFPLYARLINELGYEVVLSKPSDIGNTKATAAICYPCEIVHGAVYDLLQRDVDFIFLPRTIEMDIPDEALHCYTCPSTTVIADVIKAAFNKAADRILCPHIGLSSHLRETTIQEIGGMAPILDLDESMVRDAGAVALSHHDKFMKAYLSRSKEELERISDEPAVILAGRPYITCSPDVNLALPRKITSRGYHAIPADMLPFIPGGSTPRDVWRFTQQITNTVAYVKTMPNFYACLVSCFSCGPDASMYHFIRNKLAGQAFCYLEIDSHTAHAGFETRVGAFLDIIEEKRLRRNG